MNHASTWRQRGADLFELLGSMRFAVSLLVFICVASLIGTVLPQNQVANTYIDQFGPFWYAVFDVFAIWHVYNSWWFLLIMAFLVVSTTLCLLRNTPKMLKDMRSFREHVRGSSLRAFHHKVETGSTASVDISAQNIKQLLERQGYKVKERIDADSRLLAAKKGSSNRLGYIFAHASIVVICIGGILDSELPIRLQVWLGGKEPITQNMLIANVPESGRLSVANPSYRANMLVPEGGQSGHAIVSQGEGVLVQPLPFSLKLSKFDVEYYSTGMPSSFKSYVEVHDPATNERFERVIAVNEPLRYKGVTVYQSSFDDGGSTVKLQAWPLEGSARTPFEVSTVVDEPTDITLNASSQPVPLRLDVSGLRVINVENINNQIDPQPKALLDHVASVTGSATSSRQDNLRNVGPSVQYRLTGADGQSYEYNNYMIPMVLDASPVYLVGVRQTASESYRYIRIPADNANSLNGFMNLRAALNDPALRGQAARVFATENSATPEQAALLETAAAAALEAFASGGFNAVVERVPAEERDRFLGFAVPMIQLSLTRLRDLDLMQRSLDPIDYQGENGPRETQWLQQALLALSSLPEYPAPILLSMTSFDHIEASVFQVARSPGQNTVYLGCLFLIIGVFSMFYIRDRRIWVWVQPDGTGSHWLAAMTSQRRNLDFDREFGEFQAAINKLSS